MPLAPTRQGVLLDWRQPVWERRIFHTRELCPASVSRPKLSLEHTPQHNHNEAESLRTTGES